MNFNLPVWDIIKNADLMVTSVLLVLAFLSFYVWFLIFAKRFRLSATYRNIVKFQKKFWQSKDLIQLYTDNKQAIKAQNKMRGIEVMFDEAIKEFVRLSKMHTVNQTVIVEGVERRLRVAYQREKMFLSNGIAGLATIGSVSPYIGLFGTVWGIMVSFQALATLKQTSLSAVAPGLAEALVATGMGLFVAIPAVIAYNRLTTRLKNIMTEYELFADELLTILSRQLSAQPSQETYQQ